MKQNAGNDPALWREDRMKRTSILVLAALAMSVCLPAAAQTWPDRPIRWIVPYAAGGNSDGLSRALGKRLGETLGQQIVIENKPGGDTIIGMGALAQSPADGYTIGFISDTQAIHIATNRTTPYDFQKDFIPVLQMARIPFTFVVNADDAGTQSLAQFIQYAKDNPGWLTFGSVGPGSPHETAFLWLQHLGGFKSAIVPYRGVAPAMQDLLAGQVKSLFWGGVASDQWVKEKKIRRMAVTTRERLSLAPEAETISSLYPEYELVSWYGLAVPRGTPPAIVERFNTEVNKALQSDDIKSAISNYGFLPAGGSSDALQAIITADIAKYRKILPTFAASK